MPTIVIATDFGEVSKNAARYTCEMVNKNASKYHLELLLLHIHPIPAVFAGEASGDAWLDSFNAAEEKIANELVSLKESYPELIIKTKVHTGWLRKSLEQECSLLNAAMLVLGASGEYDDIWSWNSEILGVLRRMQVPVLLVPGHVSFKPIKHITYACNYKNITENTPFDAVKTITEFMESQLDVVYVATPQRPGNTAGENGERLIHQKLDAVHPAYHTLNNPNVIAALENYIVEQHTDLLLLIPHRYGIWENAFHRSKTYGMAKLNRLPVLALREK